MGLNDNINLVALSTETFATRIYLDINGVYKRLECLFTQRNVQQQWRPDIKTKTARYEHERKQTCK